MPFTFNKFSGLLLIFFVHGLVYAFLLLRKGIANANNSDKWLSLFLLLCIMYICPWMLGFAGWYNGLECLECRNFLFYMPLQHTLLMGPVIWMYVQSLLNPHFTFNTKQAIHFIPAILYIIWNIIVAVYDRLIVNNYVLMDGITDPDFQDWYIAAGLISLLVYLSLSLRYYFNYRQFIVQELSFADTLAYQWVRNFLIACFIYFLSNLVMGFAGLMGISLDYKDQWWYYLLFAILFYYIAITGYSNSIESKVKFELDFLKYRLPLQLAAPEITVTEDADYAVVESVTPTPADIHPFDEWKAKILHEVTINKQYQNPELTLTDLAKSIGTNASFLSKVINQSFQLNFNDFINSHRVEEVKAKLSDVNNAHLTIMGMAYDAGFNSKATFNRAFKKFTGQNPSNFSA